jgi:imidazolonepropionase-like amidohydrolase
VEQSFALRNVNVLDETGGFEGPIDVLVENGVVGRLGSLNGEIRVESYDLDGLFLMPGIFDCHAHVSVSTVDPLEALRTPLSRWAIEAADNGRRVLEAGVTFVRDAGGMDAGIRDAFAAGLARGPRAQISIVMLTQTGGHADGFLPGAGLEMSTSYIFPDYPGRPPYLVDGADEMRRTVRTILRSGADWIKLATTGGVISPTDDPERAELTLEEIEIAVAEASRKGKFVFAHANAGEGLDNAVRAGVRSIEHGVYLNEEQAAAMATTGCFFVPTLAIARDVMRMADAGKLPPYAAAKANEMRDRIGGAVEIAAAAGVKIATGADFVTREQHGRNLEEIFLLREAGLTVSQALIAATRNGAELCGVDNLYGRIAPGYVFDAILLDEEPTDDLSLFDRPGAVTGVFKGGDVIVRHPRLATATEPVTV